MVTSGSIYSAWGCLLATLLVGNCLVDETADHLLFDCRELAEVKASILGGVERGSYLPSEELIERLRQFDRALALAV
jgi:hypothetical protein